MDSVRSGPFGSIFRPDNYIFGQVRSHPQALSCLRRATDIYMHCLGLFDKALHAKLCRQEQVTTGPKVTTQRVQSLLTALWTPSARKQRIVTAYKVCLLPMDIYVWHSAWQMMLGSCSCILLCRLSGLPLIGGWDRLWHGYAPHQQDPRRVRPACRSGLLLTPHQSHPQTHVR